MFRRSQYPRRNQQSKRHGYDEISPRRRGPAFEGVELVKGELEVLRDGFDGNLAHGFEVAADAFVRAADDFYAVDLVGLRGLQRVQGAQGVDGEGIGAAEEDV